MESLAIFAENLCHSDKLIRHSTLRILCYYELLNCEHSSEDQHAEKKMRTEVSQSCFADDRGSNVLQLLSPLRKHLFRLLPAGKLSY